VVRKEEEKPPHEGRVVWRDEARSLLSSEGKGDIPALAEKEASVRKTVPS